MSDLANLLIDAIEKQVENVLDGITIDVENIDGLEKKVDQILSDRVEASIEEELKQFSVSVDDIEGFDQAVSDAASDAATQAINDYIVNADEVNGLDSFVQEVVKDTPLSASEVDGLDDYLDDYMNDYVNELQVETQSIVGLDRFVQSEFEQVIQQPAFQALIASMVQAEVARILGNVPVANPVQP